MNTSVYFAGKMGSGRATCDCHPARCHPHCDPDHADTCTVEVRVEHNWRYRILHRVPRMGERCSFDGFTFGGPWFVDTTNHDVDAEHITTDCLAWIDESHCFFAWISTLDGYGTLAELGYAKARGKPIFVAFDRASLTHVDIAELWFIRRLADEYCVVDSANSAFAIFTHWLYARRQAQRW